MKLNFKMLLATILVGGAVGVADWFLYDALVDSMPRYVLIPILLAILAVAVTATIFIMAKVTEDTDEEIWFLNGTGALIIGLVVLLVVLFGVSVGLEYLYDTDVVVTSQPTSYIFLLDESGSMFSNDEYGERNNAVNYMMSTLPTDTPYAVYVFAANAACARPMAPFSMGAYVADEDLNYAMDGGDTAIRNGLQTILNDYYRGAFATGGNNPRVILLSDGSASDISIYSGMDILDDYRAAGISISAVGLGYDDQQTMSMIAGETGGDYIHIDNASQLSASFSSVARSNTDRDLFSERRNVSSDTLYAVLRVLFLTVLGAIIAVMKAVALAKDDSKWLVIIAGCIASLVGALAVELLVGFEVPMVVGMIVYCVLVAATPAYMPVRTGEYGNRQLYSYY